MVGRFKLVFLIGVNMKKILFFSMIFVVSAVVFILLNNFHEVGAVYTPQEGDLIKVDGSSAIYKIDANNKRRLFVNAVTFWTYYTGSWGDLKYYNEDINVITISQNDFNNIISGNHITIRPGRKLIKFENSPKVYIVYDNAKIKHLNDDDARSIYGPDWPNKVVTIQNGFELDYELNNDGFVDGDNDGVGDNDELNIYGTNPNNSDSDGDGYSDGVELTNGYNPNGSGKIENLQRVDNQGGCTENWSCNNWSTCANNSQSRTCTDSNTCGTTINKPATNQSCSVQTCTENWSCNNWSTCANNSQSRTCTDSNTCGTTINKPATNQSCSVQTCTENWNCNVWSTCANNSQSRTCTDSNTCGTTINKPATNQSCTTPVTFDSPFGAHGETDASGISSAQFYQELAGMGVKYKRNAGAESLSWDAIDGNLDETYYWNIFDSNLSLFESNGITPMITIKSLNQADKETAVNCPNKEINQNPCNWTKYENFLAASIQRYKNRIKYWQIENEVSGIYYGGTEADYAELLGRSYNIIKANCPDCQVLIAGMPNVVLGQHAYNYYNSVLSEVKKRPGCSNGCFDIFDVHINGYRSVGQNYSDAVSLLASHGLAKTIWSTEFGPLNNHLDSRDTIEEDLIKSYMVALKTGFKKLFWRISECPSCIISQGQKTNSYYAYKTLISKLEGFNSVSKLTDTQYKINFSNKNPVYVLWCDSASCQITTEIQGTVRVIDYRGTTTNKNAGGIILTKSPVFVEE